MLLHAILSVLGVSVLSDIKPETCLYHTIFTWDNGGEIRRIFNVPEYIEKIQCVGRTIRLSERYFDYCIKNRHIVFSVFMVLPSNLAVDMFYTLNGDIDERNQTKDGIRVCWLILCYLNATFYPDIRNFDFPSIGLESGFSRSAKGYEQYIRGISSDQEPDGVDPYELTVYQTGQMQNSFFFMSTEDCLKVLGEK